VKLIQTFFACAFMLIATNGFAGLSLDKTADTAVFSVAGESINYDYLVTASAAPVIGPITVSDDKVTVTCKDVDEVGNNDDNLDPGEQITCDASYVTVADDITAGFITNKATAYGDGVGTASNEDTVTVNYLPPGTPVLTLYRTADPETFSEAGQVINYSYLVTSAGNAPVRGPTITVTDSRMTVTCPDIDTVGNVDHNLDPGESLNCTSSLSVIPADISLGYISTTSTASSVDASSDPVPLAIPFEAQNCGEAWIARSATDSSDWRSVTYGGGQFVAVARSGTNRIMTSPDGITWTARSATEANSWNSVTYGDGQFVAVASSGTNRVMTSPDGIIWTARSAAENNSWVSVTYGGGQFVAVAANGANWVMTSPDGINWTTRSTTEGHGWLSVTYGGGQFVAVTDIGTKQVMTSPDGINWTARSAVEDNEWRSVTYGGGQFVAIAVGGVGPYRVMTSPDGTTWTARTPANNSNWSSVTYGGGQFVAVAGSGTSRVMTSPDGINWTARSVPELNGWVSVTYGGGQFAAVALSGENRVMTSSCDQATPAEGTAVLAIQKVFSDGNNETDVTLKLRCTSGSYAPVVVPATPDTGLQHFFIIDKIPLTNGVGVNCKVTEEPVAGYSAQYRCPTVDSMSATDPSCEPDGDTVPPGNFACSWTNVQAGDSNSCVIVNKPDPVKVEVTKLWDVTNAGGDYFDRDAEISIICDGKMSPSDGKKYGKWYFDTHINDSMYVNDQYTVTVEVIPNYPSSYCYAEEDHVYSAVQTTSDCGSYDKKIHEVVGGMEVSAGQGDSCTITNTLFFEGVPTLNQWGMAIMALLMLGLGMVGFRRFA
jgi:hypothetical protein